MCDEDKTSNSVQACSDLAHVVLVLVGVRRVTVVIVHIGLEGVLVVIHFCVAIFVRDFLYQEMFSLHISQIGHSSPHPLHACHSHGNWAHPFRFDSSGRVTRRRADNRYWNTRRLCLLSSVTTFFCTALWLRTPDLVGPARSSSHGLLSI